MIDSHDMRAIVSLYAQLSRTIRVSAVSMKKSISHTGTEVWVVRDAGNIVGMATIVVVRTLAGIFSHIEDVVVDEQCRGRGLGSVLIQKLIERARARHAVSVSLTSKPSRVAANELYQKLGFEKKETNVYRMMM